MPKPNSQSTPKRNSLLNYFTKSDKSDNKSDKGSPKVTTSGTNGSQTPQTPTGEVDVRYKLYDLVWAKLEGFPWWPSIICPHPTTSTHIKKRGKSVHIHVQFFDDPVSRAWIKLKDLKDYNGKHKSDVPLLKDAKWNQAIEFADQASKVEPDERWTLIAELRPSDDEDGIELIDDDVVPQKDESLNSSGQKSPNNISDNKSKDIQKLDLKRKNSQRDVETKDKKKFKRIEFDSEEEETKSDEEFKVGSSEDSDDSEVDVKEIVEESISEVSFIETDSDEPKAKKHSSKSKKKSNKKSHKSKAKKKTKSKKSRNKYDSDETSEDSDIVSSDSEPKRKSSSKKKSSTKKSKHHSSDSEAMDSNQDNRKVKKENVKSEKNTNWLSQRTNSLKGSEKKVTDNDKGGAVSKANKSVISVADESFVAVADFSEVNENKDWPHLTSYEFLKPEKIKDKKGRFKLNRDGQLNPDYDPTTLTVPESFLNDCSPCQRQWWLMKADNFDTIFFFKMGKFYELFHMDAVIAVNELQIAYMRGDMAHAGFPEKAYKRYADVLIQRGYKVARVEQTETPQMMDERIKKSSKKVSKFDRVVKREICRVSSIGTRMASVIDPDMTTDGHSYLVAITENAIESGIEFGVCFIDVSIGKFNLGQFLDDRYCSRLRTLIAHNPPIELLFDRSNLSNQTKQLIENCAPNARKEIKKEFWNSKKTLKYLTENNCFEGNMSQVLVDMLDETDLLRQTPKPEYELAIRSFGAVIEYLVKCLIGEEVLTMNLIEQYKPCDIESDVKQNQLPANMILDSFTIRNLEVFQNSLGGSEGTLSEVLDFCSTPFGKRLLQKWICSPLCDIKLIESRQKAVFELSNNNIRSEVDEAIKMLKKLPDLERLLTKVHTQSSAKRAKSHPDSRAILFESDVYSKRKITDFLSVLEGFKQSIKIVETFHKHIQSFESSILVKCLSYAESGGMFPNLKGKLNFFDNAFDHNKAKKEGKITPQIGTDPEYDFKMDQIEAINQELKKHLAEQCQFFGCKVIYFGTGKNRFQLEVPENATKRITRIDKDYILQSSRKGFKRYWTPFIQRKLEELIRTEEAKESVLQDIMRRVMETFDKHYKQWSEAIHCLSLLDVLINLSKSRSFLEQNGSPVCQPKFTLSDKPFVHLIESRNPSLLKYCPNFIANDISIESELLLVTGPNMGGKSTLMRQLGLIVIMAQIGAYVPAQECTLSPVDRIFTRIGAFDRIVEGESTFFVELSETALVLKHATKHSLVLIDELGRGTSTFDGTAIACAVTKELSENIKCRTLFSSHYHSLVDEFRDNPSVRLVHMACAIENENEIDPTEESITFLYKLKSDSCPKSYGFNAAQLAGIPKQVIRKAFTKAKEFERQNLIETTFRQIIENNVNEKQVLDIIPHLKSFCIDA